MRSISEQVDQFVEGYFDGSIITALYDEKYLKLFEESKSRVKIWKDLANNGQLLHDELIPKYIKVKGEEKEQLAEEIFDIVLVLRAFGLIRNNPESLKELNLYKTLCFSYQDRMKDLNETIMKLRVGSSSIK